MKTKFIKIFWGIVLISLGCLSLTDTLGIVNLDLLPEQVWTIVFTVTSAVFFLFYFLSGVKQWGWLFPALIFAALALTINMTTRNPSSTIAILFLLSIAIPFYVGFFLNRRHRGLLIPAWILTVVAVIPVLSGRIHSDLIGALFLYTIALPFLFVYLVDRRCKWALITSVVMAFIGTLPLVNYFIHGDIQGFVVMSLFSLPFFVTYFVSKKNWWALIPAGGFTSIGLVSLLDTMSLITPAYISIGHSQIGIYASLIFLGFAATFMLLWLMRGSRPTEWAKYPAIGFLIIALMGIGSMDLLPAVILFLIGVFILTGAFLKKGVTHSPGS
jgi:uncharacterized membrane protein (DUF441 family)